MTDAVLADQGAETIALTTITFRYDAREDRLHMTGSSAEGLSFSGWVTRRLVVGSALHLASRLEEAADTLAGEIPQRQGLARIQAQAAFVEQAPQEALPRAPGSHVIDSLEISLVGSRLQLRFAIGAQAAATLSLDRFGVHRLLSSLYSGCAAAGWDRIPWPDWLRSGQAPELLAKPSTH